MTLCPDRRREMRTVAIICLLAVTAFLAVVGLLASSTPTYTGRTDPCDVDAELCRPAP